MTLRFLSMMLIASVFFFNCEGPEGPEGPQGEQGEQGIQGLQGDPGNANVTLLRFTQDISWDNNAIIRIDEIDQLNQNVLDNYAILSYFKWISTLYAIPGIYGDYLVDATYTLETANFWAYDSELTEPGDEPSDPDEVRIILIESSSIVNGRSKYTPQERLMYELEAAGIDINDYAQVAEYYGLPE